MAVLAEPALVTDRHGATLALRAGQVRTLANGLGGIVAAVD